MSAKDDSMILSPSAIWTMPSNFESCARSEVIDASTVARPAKGNNFEVNGDYQGDDFPEFKDSEMGQEAS